MKTSGMTQLGNWNFLLILITSILSISCNKNFITKNDFYEERKVIDLILDNEKYANKYLNAPKKSIVVYQNVGEVDLYSEVQEKEQINKILNTDSIKLDNLLRRKFKLKNIKNDSVVFQLVKKSNQYPVLVKYFDEIFENLDEKEKQNVIKKIEEEASIKGNATIKQKSYIELLTIPKFGVPIKLSKNQFFYNKVYKMKNHKNWTYSSYIITVDEKFTKITNSKNVLTTLWQDDKKINSFN